MIVGSAVEGILILAVVDSESHIPQVPQSVGSVGLLKVRCHAQGFELTNHKPFFMRLIIFKTHVWECY